MEHDVYVVIARFPPPIGGVSVFARRKADSLRARGERVLEVNLGQFGWPLSLVKALFDSGDCKVLVNTLHPFVLSVLWLFGLLSSSAIYDHNASRHYRHSRVKSWLLFFFCRRASEVTVVHPRLAAWFSSNGVTTSVESPFIPPDASREVEVWTTYPPDLHTFLAAEGQFVILNSAWRYISGSGEGDDLYGLGQTLALLEKLVDRGVPCRLVFSFAEFNRNQIPVNLLALMDQLIDRDALYVLQGQQEMWPLFSRVDLFLRTTSTDGESVSVLEAIHFNCPVIASDVVPRPQGVRTYQHKSLQSLFDAVLGCAKAKLTAIE